VVIESFQAPNMSGGADPFPFLDWAKEVGFESTREDEFGLWIDTLEGEMLALEGDWIIKGVAGEFYPCKPDIFALTYELA